MDPLLHAVWALPTPHLPAISNNAVLPFKIQIHLAFTPTARGMAQDMLFLNSPLNKPKSPNRLAPLCYSRDPTHQNSDTSLQMDQGHCLGPVSVSVKSRP